MNPPCKDCITYAICRNQFNVKPNYALGPFLTKMGNKCYMLKDYILLKDLNIEMPPNDMPMKDRAYFNIPYAKRLIALFIFMGWSEKHDMGYYYDIAYPDGKIK